jgi:hypothetical protein
MSTATLRYPGPLGEVESSPKTASPRTASPKIASPKIASPKIASPKSASDKAAVASRKGLLARFYDALIEARMRQAMRELALHRHLVPENSITIDR